MRPKVSVAKRYEGDCSNRRKKMEKRLEESVVKFFKGNLMGTLNSLLRTPFFK
jgi:hypothetical protein